MYVVKRTDDGDMAELAHALGVAARARGMTREGLYKALRPNAQPRFETVARVCKALGVRLHAEPAPHRPGENQR